MHSEGPFHDKKETTISKFLFPPLNNTTTLAKGNKNNTKNIIIPFIIVEEPDKKPDKPEGPCSGSYPASCDFTSGCTYSAEWTYDATTDAVNFKVMAKLDPSQKWIAIGFSVDRQMVRYSVYIVFL